MNSDILKIAALTLVVALLLAGAPMSFAVDKTAGQKIDETARSIKNRRKNAPIYFNRLKKQ